MSTFWTVVFAAGAAQGLFLCLALLARRTRNRTPTRVLAALVGVATTMIVVGALIDALSPDPYGLLLMFLNINTELAIGPLMLLFARALVDPERWLTRRDAVHFVPMLAGYALWVGAWALLGNAAGREAFLDSAAVPVYMLFKAGWLFGYVAAAHRTLRCDARVSRIHAVGRRPVTLAWLRHAVLALGAMAGTIYLVDFATRFRLIPPVAADPYGSLVLAVMIYLASLMVLQRPWVLSLRMRPTAGQDLQAEAARVTACLRDERPWLRPDLSLGELATTLKTSEHRLSAVITEGLGTSFYPLVNRYRLEEFERLARDPEHRRSSVLELAYQAGFNSKAAFYRVFRASHGTTPTAFRDAI